MNLVFEINKLGIILIFMRFNDIMKPLFVVNEILI